MGLMQEETFLRSVNQIKEWRKRDKTMDTIHLNIIDDKTLDVCLRRIHFKNTFASKEFDVFLEDETRILDDHILLDPSKILENYTNEKRTDENQTWIQMWSLFASRFGASLAVLDSSDNVEKCAPHLPTVIPHIIPVWIIVVSKSDVTIASPPTIRAIPFPDVLRFAHRNMDRHSESIHLCITGLLECFHQLSLRGIMPNFSSDMFMCDDVQWLQCDPVLALESMTTKTDTSQIVKLSEQTELWRTRKISNLEYLLILNEYAGRRRGEVHNHPFLPWVVDFSSENEGWRQLNRSKFRLQKGDDQLREMYTRKPAHHVAELLSDIGYLVYKARVESKERLCKHVRSKWVPLEYPVSLRRMFVWTPDECIPELYEDPSLIKSIHEDMPDLELPSFVKDAKGFIRWHRGKLESEEVDKHLHEWIDLAFGYLLSGEHAVDALNVHLCFVDRSPGLISYGVVQLFHRPHPKRLLLSEVQSVDSLGLSPPYRARLEGLGVEGGTTSRRFEEDVEKACVDSDEHNLVSNYKRLLARNRRLTSFKANCIRSLITTMVEMCLPEYCNDLSPKASLDQRIQRANMLLKHYPSQLPRHLRESLPRVHSVCVGADSSMPSLSHLHLFLLHRFSIPPEVVVLHDQLAIFHGAHMIRRCSAARIDEKQLACALHRELESLRECVANGGSRDRECRMVRLVDRLLEDEQSSIATVSKLFPVICRVFSDSSLDMLLIPLKRLLHNENTVKLLDRRFLLQVSIAYGANVFLDDIIPTLVEAVASRIVDRSIVAKESIMWLAKRYGPVVCARFISSNLLRILASCYSNLEVLPTHKLSRDLFSLPLEGDVTGIRVEQCLSEISATYSTTFVTVQYLPFCADLVEQCLRRLTPQMETALISVLRITRLSMRSLNDAQLMNYLEDFVIDKILLRIVELVCSVNSSISSSDTRRIIAAKAVSLLLDVSLRVGAENAKMYANAPFELLFDTFCALYEADEELRMRETENAPRELVECFPLWFCSSLITRFSTEWGVPLLSSFCKQPVFLVPFVSSQLSSTPPNASPIYSMTGVSSGNRLFSLSSPTTNFQSAAVGGSGCFDSGGSLSALWCARVSAAVCGNGIRASPRFDHLSLCSFNGHTGSIRRLAALSNENSLVSASSDKTVKLWSVRPDQELASCQWTYKGHSRTVTDVHLMASNLLASTDGTLHVWDPFRGCALNLLEWGSEGSIHTMDGIERHTLAVASSLHSIVKIYDARAQGWAAELRVSPLAGMVRALSVSEGGRRMAVALSNGTIVVLDPRIGRVSSLSHGNYTHASSFTYIQFPIRWLSSESFVASDSDDEAVVFDTIPRIQASWRTSEQVQAMASNGDHLITVQQGNTLRIYEGQEMKLENKLKSDLLPGQVTSIAFLPLNNAFLLGSNSGAIRLMC